MWSMATLHLKRSPGKATATWAHFQENPSDPEVHREGYEALSSPWFGVRSKELDCRGKRGEPDEIRGLSEAYTK